MGDSNGRPCAVPRIILPLIGTDMDLNRNQFFFIGLVVLMVGLQVRYVSAYVLNPQATKFLAERTGQSQAATSMFTAFGNATGARKVITPPEWLSWCLISVGAVLCLHSLAMPRPG
jgi:hypothetical protein